MHKLQTHDLLFRENSHRTCVVETDLPQPGMHTSYQIFHATCWKATDMRILTIPYPDRFLST